MNDRLTPALIVFRRLPPARQQEQIAKAAIEGTTVEARIAARIEYVRELVRRGVVRPHISLDPQRKEPPCR